jgi:hypothetical protein
MFDSLGSYRPATIQLLALPAFIPCLLMFLLPGYTSRFISRTMDAVEVDDAVPAVDVIS